MKTPWKNKCDCGRCRDCQFAYQLAERDMTAFYNKPVKAVKLRCMHLKEGETCQMHNLFCGWPKCAREVVESE